MSTEDILNEREATHGSFADHARYSQSLKAIMSSSDNLEHMSCEQVEALEMIAHKIGRILAGNPNHQDHWDDIAGYATLVSKTLVSKSLQEIELWGADHEARWNADKPDTPEPTEARGQINRTWADETRAPHPLDAQVYKMPAGPNPNPNMEGPKRGYAPLRPIPPMPDVGMFPPAAPFPKETRPKLTAEDQLSLEEEVARELRKAE